MLGKGWHWSKQAFLCFLPIYPLGHLFINGYRLDSPLSWIYIKRVDYPIPDHLSELIESELENLEDLPKADLLVTLTDKFDARSYGGFYLRPAVEMQIPLRAAIRDLEEAAHLGSNIEVDIGIARKKLKMSMNSKLGERLLTEFIISDAARHFIVQRELRRANSGKALCIPIFLWAGTFGVSFLFLNLATPLVGPIAAFSLSSAIALTSFYTLYNRFTVFLESKLDIDTCKKSDLYLEGAEDFLKSTMKLNRLLRSTMGVDGAKCIAENGDRIGDKWPYSKRLSAIERFVRERNFDIKRHYEYYDA
uniref:Uncharacterized protein n=1 Tax=Parascaris univalens TaxID=6257 RepID=A0A915BGY6_PARUN